MQKQFNDLNRNLEKYRMGNPALFLQVTKTEKDTDNSGLTEKWCGLTDSLLQHFVDQYQNGNISTITVIILHVASRIILNLSQIDKIREKNEIDFGESSCDGCGKPIEECEGTSEECGFTDGWW